MSIPKIRKDFKVILKETAKAILFKDFDKKEYWIPKSICTLIKQKKDKIIVTLAVFKFEEITGIAVEDMTEAFVTLGGHPLNRHLIPSIPLVESKTKPLFDRQKQILLQHVKCRYHALFWEAGTGKTLCSLTLANSFYKAKLIDLTMIMCPAHIKEQWIQYARDTFPNLPIEVFSIQSTSFEKSNEKFIKKLNNIEGNKHLIIDESHLIKNQSAKRTKNITKYVKSYSTTICTATPIGKNAGDLYHQFFVMDKSIIGEENYNGFLKKFLLLGGIDGQRIVALQNTKDLSDRISPYISNLTKADIRASMPKKKYIIKNFELNENQKKAINFINKLFFEIQSKNKTGYIAKEKMYQIAGFLQKISSGFIPNQDQLRNIFSNLGSLGDMADNVSKIKTISYKSNNNRIELLKEVLKQYSGQAIIWCKYLDEVSEIHNTIDSSRKMFGEMTQKQRHKISNDFRDGKFKYLIASIQLGSGLDFPTINLSINYTSTWDFINRKQLEDRTHRVTSNKDTTIIDLIAQNSIDKTIQQSINYKQKIASIFK